MKRAFIVFLLFLNFTFTYLSADAVDYNKLDNYLENTFSKFEIPGMAIGIIKEGKPVFQKGYGTLDYDSKKNVNKDTIFRIASCSKAFTSALIGMLVDEGKLNWDDPVIKHLPDFRLSDPTISPQIMVRDLLCHRVGFKTFDGDLLWYKTSYDRDEILNRFSKMPVKYSIRSRYGYSNIMYIVADKLIEKVSGKPYNQLLEERIFKPLGMNRSSVTVDPLINDPNVAAPYAGKKKLEQFPYIPLSAAGGINTTSSDMMNWMNMLLSKGKHNGKVFLSEKALYEIFSPHTIMKPRGFLSKAGVLFKNYGLGWYLFEYKNELIITHQGGLPGYVSEVILIPGKNIGFVIFVNELNILPTALVYELLDFHLGESKHDWTGDALKIAQHMKEHNDETAKYLEKKRFKNTSPSKELKDYAGIYTDEMYGDAKISIKDGKLFIDLLPADGRLTAVLKHFHHDTFTLKFSDEYIPLGLIKFELGFNGKVKGFEFSIPAGDFNFENLKFDKK